MLGRKPAALDRLRSLRVGGRSLGRRAATRRNRDDTYVARVVVAQLDGQRIADLDSMRRLHAVAVQANVACAHGCRGRATGLEESCAPEPAIDPQPLLFRVVAHRSLHVTEAVGVHAAWVVPACDERERLKRRLDRLRHHR